VVPAAARTGHRGSGAAPAHRTGSIGVSAARAANRAATVLAVRRRYTTIATAHARVRDRGRARPDPGPGASRWARRASSTVCRAEPAQRRGRAVTADDRGRSRRPRASAPGPGRWAHQVKIGRLEPFVSECGANGNGLKGLVGAALTGAAQHDHDNRVNGPARRWRLGHGGDCVRIGVAVETSPLGQRVQERLERPIEAGHVGQTQVVLVARAHRERVAAG